MLRRHWWTARRFGLSPGKLVRRLSRSGLPKVLCVSLPKAGTHLVERAVCLHPRLHRRILPTLNPENVGPEGLGGVLRKLRAGQVVLAHLPFEAEYPELLHRERVKALFVVRDPRDIAVSLAHYIAGRRDHPLHSLYRERPDDRARLQLAVIGDPDARPPAPALESILSSFAGWLESEALVVRYENLIGERGGGNAGMQSGTISAIYSYLGLEGSPAFVSEVGARLFSGESPTFRKGLIGQWRQEFDPELEGLFDRSAGSWMAVYGYR
ncbi:MAG: sulfotransferase domain-containing protein [Actinobacteria bacterium]|nr:sulfotransferase domain-containing protein [Actinomycetota bacterium]